MEFNTQWNYHPEEPPPDISDHLCDSLGYRGVKEQVESFIIAGQRLDAFRSGYYDDDFVAPGENLLDLDLPIGREPYTDFSDVQQKVNAFSEHVKQATEKAHKARESAIASDINELHKLRKEASDRLTKERVVASPAPEASE